MSSKDLYYLDPGQEEPFYWEAAVLGVAFVALLVGSLGVLIIICHAYRRSRHFKEETRAKRAVQLYDSIIVKGGKSKECQLGETYDSNTTIINMPREAGTIGKSMSYDVNPDTGIYDYE